MDKLIGSCIVGQSGGPTSVINSSLYGVVRTALESDCITTVYGAEYGITGVLHDRLFDLGLEDSAELALLLQTPSSALGTCRYKMAEPEENDTDYRRILEVFRKYNVRYFFYIGGNDSMDTCNKISRFMKSADYECRVIGVPKTIDNDLWGTDHCPGFGSAAKYVATSCAEVCLDTHVYDASTLTVIEIMGRNAGWLAAASALSSYMGAGPDLIYLPEIDFSVEKLERDIREVQKRKKPVFIAISEGIRDKDGTYIAQYASNAEKADAFGHAQMGGAASVLVHLLKLQFGFKSRGIELSLLQRSAAHCLSKTDVEEAYTSGRDAVNSAINGHTGVMLALCREPGPTYKCATKLLPLSEVANLEKKVPAEFINEHGNGLNQSYIDYVLPLIQGEPDLVRINSLPKLARLQKILTRR